MDGYDRLAELLKALAHPVRIQILLALREEEACVCHLEYLLGQRQAYISQQLMKLRDAGLVRDRREGMNVYYALTDERLFAIIESGAAISGDLRAASPAGEACSCPKCQAKSQLIQLTDIQSA